MAIKYLNATPGQMLSHVLSASSQTVSMARRYHLSEGHTSVAERIDNARLEAKIQRLTAKLNKGN